MLNEGMYLQERYEIVEKIGVGGMSVVYKAKDHTLNRYVAIKVLKSEFANDPNFLSKFRTEAQSAAALAHPNIVNVYDVGTEGGLNFIVMEYVEGITLKTYIEKKGQIAFKEAISIAIGVAKGIEAAHDHHVIHRDIKPQNIIISTDGKVKVTDFGIARAATTDTIHSDVMGSVHYASPEQARNGFVDGKSDIYSLGIVMYEMVTGRVPFDADTTVVVALLHLQEEMVPPSTYAPGLPASLEGIILKCTQKSPDRRYESVGALLEDLKRALVQPDKNFAVIQPAVSQKTMVVNNGPQLVAEEPKFDINERAELEEEEIEEEEEEEEGFLNPKMEKIVKYLGFAVIGILAVMIIILALNLAGVLNFGGKDKDKSAASADATANTESMVEVPDLTDMDKDEAKDALNDLGLGFYIDSYEYSDDIEEDHIISQTNKAGSEVPANTTIHVVVSNGPESEAEMPDLEGQTEANAIAKLKSLDINYKIEYENSDTVDNGTVIKQTPKAGTAIEENTKVTITVSQGKDTVTVPSVVGYDQSSAMAMLTNEGLVVLEISTEYSDSVESGKVISQTVEAGKVVESGTTVNLVVSKGKEQKTVSVPSCSNQPQSSAIETLKAVGLNYSITEQYDSNVPAGSVISTNPAAGTTVDEGATITLTVSKGAEPVVTPSTNPTTPDDGTSSGE